MDIQVGEAEGNIGTMFQRAQNRLRNKIREESDEIFAEVLRSGQKVPKDDLVNAKFLRKFVHCGLTYRDMISTAYVTGANLDISLTKQPDFTFVGNATQPDTSIIVTHFGLEHEYPLQIETLNEISEKGYAEILVGSSDYRILSIPMRELMMPSIKAVAHASNAYVDSDNSAGLEVTEGNFIVGSAGRMAGDGPYQLSEPIYIRRQQTCKAKILGLTGNAAGSTPLWGCRPIIWGYEVLQQ